MEVKTQEIDEDSRQNNFEEMLSNSFTREPAMSVFKPNAGPYHDNFEFKTKVEVIDSVANIQRDIFKYIARSEADDSATDAYSAKLNDNV